MHKRRLSLLIIAACGLLSPLSAHASETVTYSYDAQGRLVTVSHSGTVNDNAQSGYTFDDADNRTNVTVTNANSRALVVPLGIGFKVISIPDQ